jgi:hypothetical protein
MSTLNQVQKQLDDLLKQKNGPDRITKVEIYYCDEDTQQLVEIYELTPEGIIHTILEDSECQS